MLTHELRPVRWPLKPPSFSLSHWVYKPSPLKQCHSPNTTCWKRPILSVKTLPHVFTIQEPFSHGRQTHGCIELGEVSCSSSRCWKIPRDYIFERRSGQPAMIQSTERPTSHIRIIAPKKAGNAAAALRFFVQTVHVLARGEIHAS